MKVGVMVRIQTEARDIVVIGKYANGSPNCDYYQGDREVRLSISQEDARRLYSALGHSLKAVAKGEPK